MALVKCEECDREISSDAKKCPGCGKEPTKKIGLGGYIVAGLVLLIIFNVASRDKPEQAAAPALTAEQQATKAADDADSNARLDNTVRTLKSVKAGLRDPKSVEWVSALANKDGSVVCITYRARNGFGGMNVEQAAMANQTVSGTSDAWQKHCAESQLYNVKRAIGEID
jgi:hypothetical protein